VCVSPGITSSIVEGNEKASERDKVVKGKTYELHECGIESVKFRIRFSIHVRSH